MLQGWTDFLGQGLRWHYLRGWHHGVRDLWEVASERLEGEWDEER